MESGYLSLITWDIKILGSVVCRGLFNEVVDSLVLLLSGIYGNEWFYWKKVLFTFRRQPDCKGSFIEVNDISGQDNSLFFKWTAPY
jgi:hypothetical protein